MTLTQALIERAHYAALVASGFWILPAPIMKKIRWRKEVACRTAAVVAYDRAYDVAIGKDGK